MASIAGVVARVSITCLVALLASASAAPRASVEADATGAAGLAAAPPITVDTTRTGYRAMLALGMLDDGGHAVAWLGREASAARAPWQLWVQRYNRNGLKSGPPRQLAYADEPIEPRQIAAVVRRDATVAVAWATVRPYQASLPGLMASAVRTRHFALDGKPRGPERVLDEVVWQLGRTEAATFEDLVMTQWRDGRYLVGWTVLDAWNRPAAVVQRLAADGSLLAPQDRLGPMAGRGLRLTALAAGGWLATTLAPGADARVYANITQVDVRPPIGLPLLPTLPLRSFVVDLGARGRLLVAGTHPNDNREPATPWTLWFAPSGREADRTGSLAVLPAADVALDDGTWIGLWLHAASGRLWAQRLDAHGAPLGGPLLTSATRAIKALALPDGSALLAWVGPGPDSSTGTHVFTQRLAPAPP